MKNPVLHKSDTYITQLNIAFQIVEGLTSSQRETLALPIGQSAWMVQLNVYGGLV